VNEDLRDNDRASYGSALRMITAHDSVVQAFQRMFLTAQSFLVSATALFVRFGLGSNSSSHDGGVSDVVQLSMFSVLLALGLFTLWMWRAVVHRRWLCVHYLNLLLRKLESGSDVEGGLMKDYVQPFLSLSTAGRNAKILQLECEGFGQPKDRAGLGRAFRCVYLLVWVSIAVVGFWQFA